MTVLTEMNHYETPVPRVVSENPRFLKFRRRILSPRSNNAHPYTRVLRLISHGLALASSVYIALFVDYPPGHCFTGIRQWYALKKKEFLTLSEQEKLGISIVLILEYSVSTDADAGINVKNGD